MRIVGFAYMGACVAALTAFLEVESRSSIPPSPPEVPSAPFRSPSLADLGPAVDPLPALDPIPLTHPVRAAVPRPSVQPLETPALAPSRSGALDVQAVQVRPEEDLRERRRFRRRVNRYPGPIPTPDEWEPPEGPVRIALQAGHWKADEAPRELSGLKDNGTRWREMAEWQANLEIARRAATLLEELGYEVDVLPAVVPPSYRAHLFISIHADGSNDPGASGYRVAAPRRDATGRASQIAELLERSYGDATGLTRLPTVTRRMQNYYAFNFRRYEHALHPMTIGVILETGFLTSELDRRVIVDDPDRAARGIVAAVTAFSITPPPVAAVTSSR